MEITREQLRERARGKVKSLEFAVTQTAFANTRAELEEELELARIALASLDAEMMTLYRERNPYNGMTTGWQELTEQEYKFVKDNASENAEFRTVFTPPPASVSMKDHQIRELVNELRDIAVEYHGTQQLRERIARTVRAAMLQGAEPRNDIRREHAEWSQSTFGDVGPVGPLKHLSKEALEAAAEPGDLSEWADMQFLLWDAQRRADISDEQITQAMIDKLAVNKSRQWPEPKDGEPRLHIKAAPQQEV